MTDAEPNKLPFLLRRSRFWRRQFEGKGTIWQVLFDLIFGLILPIWFLQPDGFPFFSRFFYFPLTHIPKPAVHWLSALLGDPQVLGQYLVLGVWLLFGRCFPWIVGVASGILAFGVILWFSVLAVVVVESSVLIGPLRIAVGEIPLLALVLAARWFIFVRNAIRAFKLALERWPMETVLIHALAGFFGALLAPTAIGFIIYHG